MLRPMMRMVSTSTSAGTGAARRTGAAQPMPGMMLSWKARSRASVKPPLGWDPTLVDSITTATAADLMKRPCVVSPKPNDTVFYVNDNASVKECATVFWTKKIGALLVKSGENDSVVGIISERDFVKALATESTSTDTVKDLMTPISKMVTVSLNTGVGECMELMRAHNIRHLPVMATSGEATSGEDGTHALKNMHDTAARNESNARKQFHAFEAKLIDALGEAAGHGIFSTLEAGGSDTANYESDDRPLVQRAAAAATRLKGAQDRLAVASLRLTSGAQDKALQSFPVGIISIRDLLVAMTANQVLITTDYH